MSGFYRTQLPQLISKQALKQLSTINGFKAAGNIAFEYAAVIFIIVISELYWSPLLYLLAVCLIGARQQSIMVIMHDAVHYRLFRNRKINDFVGYWLARSTFSSLAQFRAEHLEHHRYLGSDKDPDEFTTIPMKKRYLLFQLVDAVIDLQSHAQKIIALRFGNFASKLKVIGYYLGCFVLVAAIFYVATLFYPLMLFLLYWYIPHISWHSISDEFRGLGEHYEVRENHPLYNEEPMYRTRDILPQWWDRLFIGLRGINYHLSHHLYPSVPLYNLSQLQRELAKHEYYQQNAHVTHGYFNVLKECIAKP